MLDSAWLTTICEDIVLSIVHWIRASGFCWSASARRPPTKQLAGISRKWDLPKTTWFCLKISYCKSKKGTSHFLGIYINIYIYTLQKTHPYEKSSPTSTIDHFSGEAHGDTIWLWHSQFAMENHHAINRGKVNHLFRLGPSIPWLCYLYHGYVSHNQRVTLVCWLEATPWTNPVWPQQPPVLHGFRPLFEVEKPWKLRSDRSVQRINMDKPAGASHWLAKLSIHLASHLPSYSMIFTFLFWCCICI